MTATVSAIDTPLNDGRKNLKIGHRPPNFTRDEDALMVGYFVLGLTAGQIAFKMDRKPRQVHDRLRVLGVSRCAAETIMGGAK